MYQAIKLAGPTNTKLGFSVVKNPSASAGDPGSPSGSGRSPGEGMATHSSNLAWEVPRTEKPGGLQSVAL